MPHSGLLNPEKTRASMVCVEANGERRFDGVANAEGVEEQQQRLISGDEKVLVTGLNLKLPTSSSSASEPSNPLLPGTLQPRWTHHGSRYTLRELDEEEDEETQRVDERDMSLHGDFLREVKELVGEPVALARVFVNGRYVDVTRSLLQCLLVIGKGEEKCIGFAIDEPTLE
ncbi:hypothetical protein LR48_Vigan07g028100 [Vigna angularis]|uniref:Uncharacterized protein n=1 Tax=Phaseolus angularis TaxID=3914 RepID=A0A0L9UVH8_PHAAN|nr:hypothetical protein LR48_Vigan07g028100 [Vigna angularis]